MKVKKVLITTVLLTMILFPFSALALQYHLLIIAPSEFIDELQPLKNWKDETGRPTAIVSYGEVLEKDYGDVRDEPEQMKRFIEEYVKTYNVQHVMLAGDSDKLPVRYVKAYNTKWGDKYYPSDLYYMDLYDSSSNFDDWDGDGDGIIGEIYVSGDPDISKANLDDINMYPDVSVARVPASTETEMTTYVNKVIDYESTASSAWFNNALLSVDADWGTSTKMDGVVPYLSGFTVNKFYMDSPPYDSMTKAQRANAINTAINSGLGFVNHYGHGNRLLWESWYESSDISGLTNTSGMFPIIFATACYTGRFHYSSDFLYADKNGVEWDGSGAELGDDHPEPMPVQPSTYDSRHDECMAEHFLVKNSTGGVGYIGCTSIVEHGAWLEPSQGMSPYFFEEYYNGTRTLGELWKKTLEKFINDLQDPTTGGMYYFSFLHIHKMIPFGDPSLVVGGIGGVTSTTTTTVPVTTTTTSICQIIGIYGEQSEETAFLRYFRDEVLNKTPEGQEIIRLYYQLSPVMVEMLEEDEEFREEVKAVIDEILPLIRGEME